MRIPFEMQDLKFNHDLTLLNSINPISNSILSLRWSRPLALFTLVTTYRSTIDILLHLQTVQLISSIAKTGNYCKFSIKGLTWFICLFEWTSSLPKRENGDPVIRNYAESQLRVMQPFRSRSSRLTSIVGTELILLPPRLVQS